VESLEAELERARTLDVASLADAIERIGFECTRCGACCTHETTPEGETEPHTATVFPDEVRELQAALGAGNDASDAATADGVEQDDEDSSDADRDTETARDEGVGSGEGDVPWRDVARPMPYGLVDGESGPEGETFEWALQTDACGDCVFYEETDGVGACSVHADRPLICATYPFSVDLDGTTQPMGEAVDSVPLGDQQDGEPAGAAMLAHECEGLGREIDRESAEALAAALKERAIRELEEAIAVRETYEPVEPESGAVIVHDSEGAKTADGSPVDERRLGR
jgi:hypothetical protein